MPEKCKDLPGLIDILANVERPGRYIGGEVNSTNKNGLGCRISFALAFPDVYEVAMSHLGIQILYSVLNSRAEIRAERVFAPWPDMERILRSKGLPLSSLESQTPLYQFDIIGFSLQYELSFTNILNMLDLGGIPLRSSGRGDGLPIVLGGGPCAFNPAPLEPFFDAFAIGEGEEVATEIAMAVSEGREKGLPRKKILESLASIPGIYVPSVNKGSIIRKRTISDLNRWRVPLKPVVPLTRVVHDRVNLEIARGCTRGCRFCQAGMVWRPVRERSRKVLEEMADEMLNSTGYEEISLLSLSTGDYSMIEPLLSSLMGSYCDKRIAISLPSLRTETLSQGLIEEIRKVRKTSFTIAPEAGTERMRRLINKGNTEEDLVAAAERVFAAGWRSIKLYFMIGLPGETEEDLQGIVRLAEKVAQTGRNRRQVTVSISSFVPKPHTPFQWHRQIGRDEIAEKQQFLKSRLKSRNITLKWHNSAMSLLEGVISRGDEKIAGLIENAWHLGARFDGWSDLLSMEIWDKALRQCSIDPDNYLRQRHVSERLPWDNIDCGVSREFLIDELEKSALGELTFDCRTSACTGCGACPEGLAIDEQGAAESKENMIDTTRSPTAAAEKAQRYGLKYAKEGKSRFISHLDTASVFGPGYSSGWHTV